MSSEEEEDSDIPSSKKSWLPSIKLGKKKRGPRRGEKKWGFEQCSIRGVGRGTYVPTIIL